MIIVAIVFALLMVVVSIAIIASFWIVFTKAGEPGWAALVPIYNTIVMLRIAGKEWWWVFLVSIPPISIYFGIVAMIDFAKAYGKEVGFALGLMFLPFIFFPMLAFGDARHESQGGKKKSKRSMGRFADEDDEDDDRGRGRGRGTSGSRGGIATRGRPQPKFENEEEDEEEEEEERPRPKRRPSSDDDDRPRRR